MASPRIGGFLLLSALTVAAAASQDPDPPEVEGEREGPEFIRLRNDYLNVRRGIPNPAAREAAIRLMKQQARKMAVRADGSPASLAVPAPWVPNRPSTGSRRQGNLQRPCIRHRSRSAGRQKGLRRHCRWRDFSIARRWDHLVGHFRRGRRCCHWGPDPRPLGFQHLVCRHRSRRRRPSRNRPVSHRWNLVSHSAAHRADQPGSQLHGSER